MKVLLGISALLFFLINIALTPDAQTKFWRKVRRGQTLGLIAKTYEMSVKELKALNKIKTDLIRKGDKLKIEPKEILVVASWYGIPYHGRQMANCKIYDMNKVSGAHKTLPLGTIVRVTNPKNQKSIVLEISDRGPYIKGRDLDLSKEAARRLGVKRKGVAKVKMRILSIQSKKYCS